MQSIAFLNYQQSINTIELVLILTRRGFGVGMSPCVDIALLDIVSKLVSYSTQTEDDDW